MEQASPLTVQLSALGIGDLQKYMDQGLASPSEVFAIVEARIKKRDSDGRSQLRPVVAFRNQLAETLRKSGLGNHADRPLPSPSTQPAKTGLSATEPEKLADEVFNLIGVEHVAAFIARLTARVAGA